MKFGVSVMPLDTPQTHTTGSWNFVLLDSLLSAQYTKCVIIGHFRLSVVNSLNPNAVFSHAHTHHTPKPGAFRVAKCEEHVWKLCILIWITSCNVNGRYSLFGDYSMILYQLLKAEIWG
jgi:hypothetical protein